MTTMPSSFNKLLLRPRKRGRSCDSGPPWMLITTGRLPVNRAGGLYMNPVIASPSDPCHVINSASEICETSTAPVSARVHRSIFPDAASNEYALHGTFGEIRSKLNAVLFGRHSTPCTEPGGTPLTRAG